MSEQTNDTAIALLSRDMKHFEEKVIELEREIKVLQDDKERAFKWGIMALGAAVIAMGTWIFTSITGRLPS